MAPAIHSPNHLNSLNCIMLPPHNHPLWDRLSDRRCLTGSPGSNPCSSLPSYPCAARTFPSHVDCRIDRVLRFPDSSFQLHVENNVTLKHRERWHKCFGASGPPPPLPRAPHACLPPPLLRPRLSPVTQGDLKIALWGGGGDMDARRRRGGGLEKWGSVSGPLFCVRTDVGAEGAGTQILARKSFFHQ